MMWPSTAVGQGLENVGALQPHVQLHVEEEPLFTDVPTCWILREELDDDPIPTRGASKRLERKLAEQVELQRFLSDHRFEGVNSPQGPPWFDVLALCAEREEVYPIHVAASLGNAQVVKLLLRQGADKEKDTSKGRTPLEAAQQAKDPRSRTAVIHLLQGTSPSATSPSALMQKWSAKDLLASCGLNP
ncbi:Receptor-likey region [Durusdinium trenchii]|uniref:Transmembrane domain-and RING domain-containing protein 6 n=1 Tax=Durusdinium trenchii TaxID=1381693 RepID=A0ABP0QQY6_9DINO